MEDKYYHTKESVDEYIKLSEGHSGKDLIDKFVPHLKPNSKILELGTGPGNDWSILDKNFQTTGSDCSEEFLKRLKNKYPTGAFIEIDASSLQTNDKFDAIYSNKVMHHVQNSDLDDSFSRQAEILNEDGYICHSFWKGEGDEIFKGMYVNYLLENDLKSLLEDKFEIIELSTYAEFEDNDSIFLIAKKM